MHWPAAIWFLPLIYFNPQAPRPGVQVAAAPKPLLTTSNAVANAATPASTATTATTNNTQTPVAAPKITTPMQLARMFAGPFVVYISGLPHTLQDNVR